MDRKQIDLILQGIDATILNMVRLKRRLQQEEIDRQKEQPLQEIDMIDGNIHFLQDVLIWLAVPTCELTVGWDFQSIPASEEDDFPF